MALRQDVSTHDPATGLRQACGGAQVPLWTLGTAAEEAQRGKAGWATGLAAPEKQGTAEPAPGSASYCVHSGWAPCLSLLISWRGLLTCDVGRIR